MLIGFNRRTAVLHAMATPWLRMFSSGIILSVNRRLKVILVEKTCLEKDHGLGHMCSYQTIMFNVRICVHSICKCLHVAVCVSVCVCARVCVRVRVRESACSLYMQIP